MSQTLSLTALPVRRFFKLLSLDRKDIGYLYVYAIFNGVITLVLPLGIQAIINLIIVGQISTSWLVLVTGVTVAIAFSGGLQIMQLSIAEVLQQRIFARASFEFAYRIPKFMQEAIIKEKHYPPELVNRFFDTLNVQKGLPKILLDFSTSALQILFALVLLAFYHPFFVFFGISLIIILFLIIRLTYPKGLRTSMKESKYKYQVAHWLEELARTMNTFKLAGNTALPLQKTDTLVNNYLRARKKHFKVLINQFGYIVLFKTLITAGLLILGSVLVVQREINIAQFVASEIVIIIVMNSVEKLILSLETIYDVLTAIEKIGAVTDVPLDNDKGESFSTIDQGTGLSIKVRDLSYTYHDQERPTLNGLDLDIKQGDRICIAGYSKAGKSTLVRMLSGLFANYAGSIAYNDIPLKNIDACSLNTHIGEHFSQEDLFEGTIKENIEVGRPNLTLKDCLWAIERVGLAEYIQSLPEGFNTIIEPSGRSFPGTVVTKLILARAIINQPRLLLMEDVLSGFERQKREGINQLLTDKQMPWTLVAVSRDADLASRCDRIVVMESGKIVDQGSYQELSSRPYFTEFFKN